MILMVYDRRVFKRDLDVWFLFPEFPHFNFHTFTPLRRFLIDFLKYFDTQVIDRTPEKIIPSNRFSNLD